MFTLDDIHTCQLFCSLRFFLVLSHFWPLLLGPVVSLTCETHLLSFLNCKLCVDDS